ncbi:MAG: SH3 domain-containing protein, partial [Acetivibrio ethanolgignens]
MKRKMVMAVLLAVGLTGICQFSDNVGVTIPYTAYAANAGTVTGSSLRVRTGAGTDKAALTYNGSSVMLSKGTKVTIKKAVEEGETTWYQVSFSYSGKTLTGYVSGDYVKVTEETDDSSSKA